MKPSNDSNAGDRSDPEQIRVLIADDHPLVRAGLTYSLTSDPGLSVVGEATSGEDTQRLCEECQPDVLLLDLRMPGPTALETMAYVHEHCPKTRVLMLTAFDDEAHVRGLVEAGVVGYLLKDEAPATVSEAVRAVMRGRTWFSQAVAEKLTRPTEFAELTLREREVLALLARGKSNSQISEQLCVAEITVRFHLKNIRGKIGAHSRAEAIRWAVKQGLGE